MMPPIDMTSNVQDLAKNLLSKLTKQSPKPRPTQSIIQLFSAMCGGLSQDDFHFPCTSEFAGPRWLYFQCFTAAAILSFGNDGYNCSLVRTPISAAQFGLRWAAYSWRQGTTRAARSQLDNDG